MSEINSVVGQSLGQKIAYWITTILIAFVLISGGVSELMRPQALMEGMRHLGYPDYVCTIIGIWKLLGAVAILAQRLPRLKEWAYAGIVIDLTGASASHFAVGDDAMKIAVPLIITVITFASWALRPSTRRL